MRAIMLLTMFAVAAPNRQSIGPVAPSSSPHDQLIGDWITDNNPSYVLRFGPTDSTFMVNGQPSPADGLTASTAIDFSKNPVAIDFMPKMRGGKMMGILKIEGDRLTINLNTGAGPRPTNFNDRGGTLFLQYRRAK